MKERIMLVCCPTSPAAARMCSRAACTSASASPALVHEDGAAGALCDLGQLIRQPLRESRTLPGLGAQLGQLEPGIEPPARLLDTAALARAAQSLPNVEPQPSQSIGARLRALDKPMRRGHLCQSHESKLTPLVYDLLHFQAGDGTRTGLGLRSITEAHGLAHETADLFIFTQQSGDGSPFYQPNQPNQAPEAGMSKRILVVCYPGNEQIRSLAEAIARHCDADLEWIKDRDNRLGLAGQLRSMAQALLHSRPWIQPARCQPAAYSLVIIGTPVWARSIASPVRSYLERYGSRCRRVAFFCTHASAGADKVLADMQLLCGSRPVDTLALRQQLLTPSQVDTAAGHFVRRFNGSRGDTASDDRLVA